MESIFVKDLTFVLSIPAGTIHQAVDRLASELVNDYKEKNPLFLVNLNGAYVFAADLLRKMHIPCQVSFVKYVSYSGMSSTEKVRVLMGLGEEVENRHVVIIEDIIDTGISMSCMLEDLRKKNLLSLRLCALLLKPASLKKEIHIDYLGMKIPNDFIIGYGLDYDGYGRNYPDIYKVSPLP